MIGLVTEFLRALVLAGAPVAALSFVLTWWALRRGLLSETGTVDALDKEIKALGKLKPKERANSNPVHEKWLKFGGGFYGVVALLTWLKIEVEDLPTQIPPLVSAVFSLDLGAVIQGVIQLFIESIMNFVAAIAWPAYWLSRIETGDPWLWFLAAWAGYWAGTRLAQQLRTRQAADDI